ncbi:hypothetical protein ACFQDF_17895 [Ectobacillus funiculus]|uniref:Uncharacterized protein n=1 Tax=Ectobacillus funiculus TaxID=137993 RepID=A0ABV5WEJ6_9BACI
MILLHMIGLAGLIAPDLLLYSWCLQLILLQPPMKYTHYQTSKNKHDVQGLVF